MDYNIQGRRTGRGAFTDAVIIVDNQIREPDYEENSRTGNHWEKIWYDLPVGATIFYVDITNSGKEYRSIEAIVDDQDEPVIRAEWERGRWSGDMADEAPELWAQFGSGA